MQVAGDERFPEDIRLKYRFIDLRREKLHRNIMLRAGRDRLDPPAHDRGRLHRVPDADPDRGQPGGRARLPGAGAAAPGQVLRAAAGAAAVQAVGDGGGVRPLLPDRAVLPRRGLARGPLAGRVLPARLRDELRDAGGRVRHHRAGDRRRVRGIRRGPRGGCAAVPPHPVRHGDAGIRQRQAGPAQSAADQRRDAAFRRLGLRAVCAHRRLGRGGARHPGAGRRVAAAQLLRQAERLGEGRGRRRARLHRVRRGRSEGADRAQPGARPHRGDPRDLRAFRGRCGVLRRRQGRDGGQVRRRGAHAAGRGTRASARPARSGSAGSPTSRCSS